MAQKKRQDKPAYCPDCGGWRHPEICEKEDNCFIVKAQKSITSRRKDGAV